MKIGIIGFGTIGKQHYRTLASFKKVSTIPIYAPSYPPSTTGFLKTQFHTCVEDLIENSDGVVIATPNHFHIQHILAALEKNRPVLCEKPLCCNRTELRLLEKTIATPSLFSIGFNYRFLEVTEAARRFIVEQNLNNIRSIHLSFNKDSAFRKKTATWRESGNSGFSGGALGDLGIHLIDLIGYLLSTTPRDNALDFEFNTCVIQRNFPRFQVDDEAFLSGKLQNTAFEILVSKSCTSHEKGFGILIKSENASFEYHSSRPLYYDLNIKDEHRQIFLNPRLHEDPENEVYGWSDSFVHQASAWLAKIKTGENGEKLANFSHALRSQNVFCEALESVADNTILSP